MNLQIYTKCISLPSLFIKIMSDNKEKTQELSLELSPEVASGTYANLAIIAHSSSEFIIDFARILPGVPKAAIGSRVIMTAENAKRLLMALHENIRRFENENGEISVKKEHTIQFPMGFGGNGNAQA